MDGPEAADTVVLGTCTVVQATAGRMEHRIERLVAAGKRVIIGGCMATADRTRLEARYPALERLAPGDVGGLEELIGKGSRQPEARQGEVPVSAILPIASGCLGRCTYCATLRARGRVRSRTVRRVMAMAASALDDGSRELLVTSQDNAAYGADIDTDLETLLAGLEGLEGEFRIRVGMLNPAIASPRARRLARSWEGRRTYRFLHLPVQSGSQRILDAMGRGHALAGFWKVVEAFRSRFDDLMLSTDIIVGFPGESEDDHRASLGLLGELEPDVINITRFSPRPHTRAASMVDRVPFGIAKERSGEVTRLRRTMGEKRFGELHGRNERVLATEHKKSGTTICRDSCNRPLVVPGTVRLGSFLDVRVTGSTWAYLKGKVISTDSGK